MLYNVIFIILNIELDNIGFFTHTSRMYMYRATMEDTDNIHVVCLYKQEKKINNRLIKIIDRGHFD